LTNTLATAVEAKDRSTKIRRRNVARTPLRNCRDRTEI
jgi:hypothetical protein